MTEEQGTGWSGDSGHMMFEKSHESEEWTITLTYGERKDEGKNLLLLRSRREANRSQRRKRREAGWRHWQGQILLVVVGMRKLGFIFYV